LLLVPQPGLADSELAVRQRHHARLLTVPANGSLSFAWMFFPCDLLRR
jgi:hypothetical protein